VNNIKAKFFVFFFFRFVYCGKINLGELQESDVLKLSITVNELNIQALAHFIQEYLIKHHDKFLQQNPIEILEIAYQNKFFTDLLNLLLKKICEEPKILFDSDKFIGLRSPLLESFLKRDDLLLDEIVIWDNLIKWCLSQHSRISQDQHTNISQDPTQWSNEEITSIGRIIHGFIPLMRFYYISSENFITKIYPFKKVIPKDLVNSLLVFHMAPNKQLSEDKRFPRQSKCNVDSIIINQNHIKIFANWIYRKVKSSEYIPYKFNLLYRASRDGNTSKAFHAKCDNKGATLVIVKIENSKQIVGGYNPLRWYSNVRREWKSTYDSFIFSFLDKNKLDSAKVGYSCGDAYSTGYDTGDNHGPIFGKGIDLNFFKGTWYSDKPVSYPKIDIPTKFIADDYEVFEVIKK
jgi:hypothetical protein